MTTPVPPLLPSSRAFCLLQTAAPARPWLILPRASQTLSEPGPGMAGEGAPCGALHSLKAFSRLCFVPSTGGEGRGTRHRQRLVQEPEPGGPCVAWPWLAWGSYPSWHLPTEGLQASQLLCHGALLHWLGDPGNGNPTLPLRAAWCAGCGLVRIHVELRLGLRPLLANGDSGWLSYLTLVLICFLTPFGF